MLVICNVLLVDMEIVMKILKIVVKLLFVVGVLVYLVGLWILCLLLSGKGYFFGVLMIVIFGNYVYFCVEKLG